MKYRYPDARVLIFARPPVPGRCKSRLAASLGKTGAARAYRVMLENLVARLSASRVAPMELWTSENSRHPALLKLRRHHDLSLHTQARGSLGHKMAHAFRDALKRADKVLIVGSDCIAIQPDHIDAALAAVDDHDTVIAPSDDGGYVLIAAKNAPTELFTNIDWGTAHVLKQTRARAARSDRSLYELETLWDVDTMEDWLRAKRLDIV